MMSHQRFFKSQQGSVVITAIMIMLVMTLLGIGLSHTVSKHLRDSAQQGSIAIARGAAASCVYEQVRWLEGQGRPRGGNLNPVLGAQAGLAIQNAVFAGLVDGYSYACDIAEIPAGENCTVNFIPGGKGNVGEGGNQARRSCYRVTSTGRAGDATVRLLVTLSKGI